MRKKDLVKNANFQVALKIVLKNRQGEILGLKMPDTSVMGGYYDLPGGRIKENEIKVNFRKVIEREIKEELGNLVKYRLREVPVAISRYLPYPNRHYMFWIFFEADYIGGDIKISPEHTEYRWLNLNKKNLKKYFTIGALDGMNNYFLKKFAI